MLAALIAAAAFAPLPEEWLARQVVPYEAVRAEVAAFAAGRIPQFAVPESVENWDADAEALRARVLDEVIYKGVPESWRADRLRVEWDRVLEPAPDYRIRLFRFEVVPDFWLPGALYEPVAMEGRVPAVLNVNGHSAAGKGREDEQMRCINLAKRGMLAIHPEWLRTGQTDLPEYAHNRIAQYDLCGVRGVSIFYLAMKRALDVLVDHPNADPDRVAMTGLSGGGWQTILLSALDTRITASAPNAGYTALYTRLLDASDIGDYEQVPSDFATVVDYTHLTALLAPRPALLIYNAYDECCFKAATAIPSVYDPVKPLYAALGVPERLSYHVNDVPGTHNYDQDNREAFYRLTFAEFGVDAFPEDIDVSAELYPIEELFVDLPGDTLDIFTLGDQLSEGLPKSGRPEPGAIGAASWRVDARQSLRNLLAYRHLTAGAVETVATENGGGVHAEWRTVVTGEWTVPVLILTPAGNPGGTALIVADGGWETVMGQADAALAQGNRVVLADPVFLGRNQPTEQNGWQFALFVHAVGERVLGIQAGQIAALGRWASESYGDPVSLHAGGWGASLAARCAAALEPKTFAALAIEDVLDTLQRVIDERFKFERAPGVFCFGLYARFDVADIDAIHGIAVGAPSI